MTIRISYLICFSEKNSIDGALCLKFEKREIVVTRGKILGLFFTRNMYSKRLERNSENLIYMFDANLKIK